VTEPQVLPTCAHCGKTITRAQPIALTTGGKGKVVAVHGGCRAPYEKAKR
jgi:hypothetical protein